MLITLRGRVGSDPMGVPMPAAMNAGPVDAFDEVLKQALDAGQEAAEAPAPRREDPATPTAPTADERAAAAREEAPTEALPIDTGAAAEAAGAPSGDEPIARPFELQDTTRGTVQDRPETSGKASEPARPWSQASEDVLVAVLQGAPGRVAAAGTVTGPAVAAVGAAGAAKAAAGTGPTGAHGLDAPLQNLPARAQATTAGYRTHDAASAQLLDQARDSVFKQILMKLSADGGEMRLRLEPPDLGELDLRLVVEQGNKLQLTISAERGDLAQLLQRHLDELKQTLQSAGLEVTDAQVQTRQQGRRDAHGDGRGDAAHDDTRDREQELRPPRLGGYVTAEGLDFWA